MSAGKGQGKAPSGPVLKGTEAILAAQNRSLLAPLSRVAEQIEHVATDVHGLAYLAERHEPGGRTALCGRAAVVALLLLAEEVRAERGE